MGDVGLVLAGLLLGWLGRGVMDVVAMRRRKARSEAFVKAMREQYGAPDVAPHQEGYFLAFYRDDSGLWAIGDTESQARELAVRRWTDLGAGLSAEATAGDPTPAEWARGLVLVYVEVESEAVLRENVLCAVRDGELAYSPWGVGAVWEEA